MAYSHTVVWEQASKCVLDPIEKLHKRIGLVRFTGMTRQSFLATSLPLFLQLNFLILKTSTIFKLEVTKLMLIVGKSLDKPQFHSVKTGNSATQL